MAGRCPVPGCGSAVRLGQFMCRSHWRGTPEPLREAVTRTWHPLHPPGNREPEQRMALIAAYHVATDAAIAWWPAETRDRR